MEERPSDGEVLELLGRVMGKFSAERWAAFVRQDGDTLAEGMGKQLGATLINAETPVTMKSVDMEIEAALKGDLP